MNNLKKHKIIVIIASLILFFGLIISMPSLAKLKNRNTIYTVSGWDGSVSTSYQKGDGTIENPFVISNGSEFAFFMEQLKTTNYEGMYFELGNDIIINPGIFEYNNDEGLKYVLDGMTYYVKEYSNEYFDNPNREGNSFGSVNIFSSINSFKGNLNGNSFTIFGIYITDSNKENLALFENLEGNITDLYISNSITYGVGDVAGIAVNSIGSTLNNLVYNGDVVNKSLPKISATDVGNVEIVGQLYETTTLLPLPPVAIEGMIKTIKLTGQYQASDESFVGPITINGEEIKESSFNVYLTENTLSEIPIVVPITTEETIISLTNLKYIIEYYDDITSGIIANSSNDVLNNIVNKSDVYGNYVSSGFVGQANENLKITQSYNTGNVISGYIGSGFIGLVKNNTKDITVSNVYNSGTITSLNAGDILAIAQDNEGSININNSFNVSNNYPINTALNSIIKVTNSYSINGLSIYNGSLNGEFFPTTMENLTNKEVMTKNSYNEFISFDDVKTNVENVWIYEKNSLPILYLDDLTNPVANININKYSWNNLSSELNMIDIKTNITFSIQDVSAINPIKEKYYYITNSRVPLTTEELNSLTAWISYEDVVTIKDSGYYVIYAKIVDSEDDITYINTDVLVLNVSGFITNITMDDQIWSTFKTNLESIYINKEINLNIYAHDDLLSINSIDYYVSDKELTRDDINNITTWQPYLNYITINEPGKYVVYARIIDSESGIRYLNTDYLLYNGYKETLTLGNNNKNYDTNYITNKSSIQLTFEKDFEFYFEEGYSHNLISNMLLPIGTKITLIDKAINKVYKKVIDTEEDLYGYNNSCEGISNCSKQATYPFNIFKQIGVSEASYYDESINYNKTTSNEKYIINIDFKDTSLVDNYYDLSFYLAIRTSDGKNLYQTLNNTISNINIYSTISDGEILTTNTLNNDYADQVIYYNSDSETNINLTNITNYSVINNKNIIDTNYESKQIGILIKIYNEDGDTINKKYLDNMLFEIGDKEYFATSDNLIKINLGSAADNNTKTLKIKTKENSSGLENGTYYIKINNFVSDDGFYYDQLNENEVIIPLVVENQQEIIYDYSFNVEMTSESLILNKALDSHIVSFDVFYSGSFIEPNIRVSLYKKDELTAYNQNYTLIDLVEYSSDDLVEAETGKYFIDVFNPAFDLNVVPNEFDNNGYKYVFELYEGTRKISKIEKYFIVK